MMVSSGWAEEKASVETGKKLFSDPALGGAGNTKTCSTCHAGGKGLEKAGQKENLAEMINSCVAGPLQGKTLDTKGAKIESLLLYIKSMENK
jgi:cytochrome c peroxidase